MPQISIQQLLQFNSSIDRLDIELLIAYIIKKTREFILSHLDFKISLLKYWQIKKLIKKRAHGIPLAYLTKHKEFFGWEFFVNKNVLIPRPETEILVEEVLKILKKDDVLIDIGTGSGCIPISIIKTFKHQEIKTFAIDSSKPALTVAHRNAKHYDVKIKFLHGNLLTPFIKTYPATAESRSLRDKLVITANLPYLTATQYQYEASIQAEPKIALVAENNGLGLYEELIQQMSGLKNKFSAFLEIDPRQNKEIKKIIRQYLPETKVKIKPDLAGLNRVVIIQN